MRAIFLNYLPRLLWMTRPSYDDRWAKKAYTQKMRRSACPDITSPRRVSSAAGLPGSVSAPNPLSLGSSPPLFQMTPDRQKALDAVKFIASHLKNEDDYAEVVLLYCFGVTLRVRCNWGD